ncbi:AI-2E family transporter [Aerococcaceae bacterium WGS1372]
MKKIKDNEKRIICYLLIAGLIILAVMNFDRIMGQLSLLLSISMPIITGFIMAYILNIPMSAIEKIYFPNSDNKWVKASRRPMSILISIILILIVLVFILNLVIPQLVSVLGTFLEAIPQLANQIRNWVIENEEIFPPLAELAENTEYDWQSIVSNTLNFVNRFTSNVIGTTLSTVSSALGIVFNLFMSLMISLFVLMSKETLARQFKLTLNTYLPKKLYSTILYVIEVTDHSFRHFITGEVIEAIILGTMVTVGMWIFQFPYAEMVGALTGVTALIPVLGAYISGAVGFLLILVESPAQSIFFLIFLVIVQQFEGNVIYPRVVGSSIGLPGLWVLVSITIGGGLMGIWGMLIAVPLASAVYKLIKNDIHYRQNRDLSVD